MSKNKKSQKHASGAPSSPELHTLINAIDAKQELLQKVSDALNDAETEGQARLAQIEQQIVSAKQKHDDLFDKTQDLTEKFSTLNSKVYRQRRESKTLQEDLDNRRVYLSEQEELINRLADDGNMALKGKQYEIEHLEGIKSTVQSDIHDLNKQKSQVIDDIQTLETSCQDLQREYDIAEIDLQSKIETLEKRVLSVRKDLESIKLEKNVYLLKLKVQEEAVDIKRRTLHKEAEAITIARRRLKEYGKLYKD